LFNPRTDNWSDHFEWQGASIAGRTPVGRATAGLLDFNAPKNLDLRRKAGYPKRRRANP